VRYLADLQTISEEGNKGYERLRPYLSAAAYSTEARSFDELRSLGLHTVGKTRLVKFTPQHVDLRGGTLTAYACVDLSGVRLLSGEGKDVTPRTRPDRQTFLPSFANHGEGLVLEENGTWSGESIC
jgi:hypothetical protein